jgi:hypothetical protein
MNIQEFKKYNQLEVYATITKVARSGLSRRIKFFIYDDWKLCNITSEIAELLKCSCNEKGLLARGCGIDMIFHTLVKLNYAIAAHDNIKLSGSGGVENSYSNYFFNADRYRTI